MAASFSIQVLTPEGLVWEGRGTAVNAPGVVGGFGILPRHQPMVAALQPGQSFTWHRDQATLYLAAKQTGRKITSRKLTQGGYRCWLQSNPTP